MTSHPLVASAAAISEPMKPPPTTAPGRRHPQAHEAVVVVECAVVDDVVRIPGSLGVPPVASSSFSYACDSPVSSVAVRASRSSDDRRPVWTSTSSSGVPRKIELVLACPESLRERGRTYGSCDSAPNSPIVPSRSVADPAARGVRGHSPADDQISVRRHRFDPRCRGQARAVESRAALTGLRYRRSPWLPWCASRSPRRCRAGGGTDRAAIFYPWYSTPARDGRWAHWYVEHEGTPTLSTPYFRRAVCTPRRTPTGPRADAGDRGERSGNARRLVVGLRLARTRATPRRGGCHAPGLEVAIHVEPYRDARRHARQRTSRSSDEKEASPTSISTTSIAIPLQHGPRRSATSSTSSLRPHDARRTRQGVRVRRSLHLRRRHVERRALQAALHTGACRRSPVRAVGRAGIRRATRDASRGGTSTKRRPHVRPHVEDRARSRRGHRDDHELQRVAGRDADRARARRARKPSYEGACKTGVHGAACVSRCHGEMDSRLRASPRQ